MSPHDARAHRCRDARSRRTSRRPRYHRPPHPRRLPRVRDEHGALRLDALDQAIRASLADDTGVTRIVAELDGAIVGSAALYAPESAAYGDLASATAWPEVRLVAVIAAVRGRGVARALVDECIRRARQSGATVLGLHTSRSMRSAMRLYERLGFVRDPEHDFQPPGAELVEGYLLRLDDPAQHQES